jgi:hypothetical protein
MRNARHMTLQEIDQATKPNHRLALKRLEILLKISRPAASKADIRQIADVG